MALRKRKRYSKDVKCVFFPDDDENGVRKVERKSSLSSVSSAKSWEKCGDSFLDTPVTKNLKSSGRTLSAIRKLVQTPALGQTRATQCNEDQVHIVWSSSDGEQSEDETQEQRLPKVVALKQQRHQRPDRPTASTQSSMHMLSSIKDDFPVIDTDSDLDEPEEDIEEDSGQQISECESESFDEKPKDLTLTPTTVTELEISGYVSDGENIGDHLSSSRMDSESFPLQTGEGSKRSVSDWVRSAQAMLQTPQKPFDRQSKTPEDSARKKRKFQSGGLAERLNRLQHRQKSAISFWRHKTICGTSTITVDNPGVLVLEVMEVQEECGMQVVHCEHPQRPEEGHQHNHSVTQERACMLVLFNRETAAQLSPAPGDIIHIHPPWQSLSIDGCSCDIILNTHFSQKVFPPSKLANVSTPKGLHSARRCMPYYLGKIFGLLEVCRTTEMADARRAYEDAPPAALCSFGGSGVLTRHCMSLLEAIEGMGQAGSVSQDVEVVVQRVYSIPLPNCSPVSILKPRVPSRFFVPPPAEKGKTRLCVLVQDSYGMFSVVQLHVLPHEDDLYQYCNLWQGKTCMLKGVKVVQRVTRERCTRLFSLIDNLWPPGTPLKDDGNTPNMSTKSRSAGPAPSFCYLLSGQESSVEPTKGQAVSLLYLPPSRQTLRAILQNKMKICRCSFVATVLYKRMQGRDVGQGDIWCVLTDPSLQEEQPERLCRRTVALCMSASCVLTSSVLEALNSPAACHVSFRDAISENGVLLCAEQSVVEVCSLDPDNSLESTTRQDSPSLTEPQVKTLPQPVRLDPLTLDTTPNSLCTLTGVIVGVEESTSYSWLACNHCRSDNLEILDERLQTFHCVSCNSAVDKPGTNIRLEVFLSCSSLSNCTLKVKLQQKTTTSILNTVALEDNEFPGYDVENVLGKEVGPLAVYVRVITRKPAVWMGLEEICL
ncbi:DNA repair-scaffolding protein [Mastacembelus armatus]|uniref:Scaffold protein involved in DNA repair n=1 Tax=Mastacembelus armatus TaxID=205130 RepID=A0A3Q3MCH7_9TELE|nr:DNA repair-scaffolding protein [Mastacembelus armatus]